MGLRVTELLCETEIDDIDLIATLPNTHDKVVWFDIPMNEVARVNVLDTRDLWRKSGIRFSAVTRNMLTNWSARSKTVFKLNLRLQKLKRSSSEGPRRSITMTL